MIETVYIELPFEKITYLDRPEFHRDEKKFKEALIESIMKIALNFIRKKKNLKMH